MSFRNWLEQEQNDVEAAILGVLPDELKGGSHDTNQILQMRTTEVSSQILDKVRNLGIVNSLRDSDPQRWEDVTNSIKNGVTFRDLIAKITGSGGLTVPKPLTDPKLSGPQFQLPANPIN